MRLVKRLLITVLALGTATGCRTTDHATLNAEDDVVKYMQKLESEADYASLQRYDAPSNRTYVKVTVDLQVEGTPVYFQNTAHYPFHHTFLSTEVERFVGRNFTMDEILFGTTKEISGGALYWAPDVQIAGLTDLGVLGFEIYFAADVNVDEIEKVYQRLKETATFRASQIAYLFPTAAQYFANKAKLTARGIPSGRISQVIGQGATPRIYTVAKSYGYLKSLTATEVQAGDYSSKDVIVLDDVPLDIGPLAGIITAEVQAPHSHVILRAENQKIPDAFVPNAKSVDWIMKHVGKLVEVETKEPNVVTVRGADEVPDIEQRAATYFATRVPELPPLDADTETSELLGIKGAELTRAKVRAYGTKGVNFGIIDGAARAAGYDRSINDGAFLIPLSNYGRHIAQPLTAKICKAGRKECQEEAPEDVCSQASATCDAALAEGLDMKTFIAKLSGSEHASAMMSSSTYRRGHLALIRGMIKKADLDPTFQAAVRAKILAGYDETVRIRLRSSTNAEDLPGLNGAGFYDSTSACLADGDGDGPSQCLTAAEKARLEGRIAKLEADDPVRNKEMIDGLKDDLNKTRPLAKAIRKVFASIWTDKAYLNRDYYRIDHMQVAMAMLAHPSYADETANGVVIATSTPDSLEVNIVAQTEDISVTNPELPGAMPDQLVVRRAADGTQSEPVYKLRSNITDGQPVLTASQIRELVEQIRVAVTGLRAVYGDDYGQRMDLEFKIDGAGKVQLKQGRPL